MSMLKRIDTLAPEERAQWNELQAGLPTPVRDGSALVVEKRNAISTVLSRTADLTPEQFLTAAIAEANALPSGCREGSVAKAVFNAAALGLLLGASRGHAFLVPFKDKRATEKSGQDVYDVQLVIGYMGFIALAYRTGFLQSLTTEVVLTDEECELWVDEFGRKLRHKTPIGRRIAPDGANVKAAYCVYQTRTGGHGITVVTRDEIEASKNRYADPWKYHYAAMARKTAVRRAAKEWAMTDSLAMAVKLDEQAEAGVDQTAIVSDRIEVSPAANGTGQRPAAIPTAPVTPAAPAPQAVAARVEATTEESSAVAPAAPVDKAVAAPVKPPATKPEAVVKQEPPKAVAPTAAAAEKAAVNNGTAMTAHALDGVDEGLALVLPGDAEAVLCRIGAEQERVSIAQAVGTLLDRMLCGAIVPADYIRLRATHLAGKSPLLDCFRDMEDAETKSECREAIVRIHAMRRENLISLELHRLLSRRASARLMEVF